MIVSVTAPIHVKSENEIRSLSFVSPFALPAYTKRTRTDVAHVLTQLPRPPATKPDGKPNRFVVLLTRISVGYLDDDNLRGSFKAVRDQIASWLGIDDGHERIRFVYAQEGCKRGISGIRIEVRDETDGETVRREIGTIDRTFEKRPRGDAPAKRVERAPLEQAALEFRGIWAELPWEQRGSGKAIVTKLALRALDPPAQIRIRVPVRALSGAAYAPGSLVTFDRHLARVRGAEAFIYRPASAGRSRTSKGT